MDFLGNGGMLAILGYFGFIFKDIPSRIASLIVPRITSSITWNNNTNYTVYNESNKWLFSKDKQNILKRHIELTAKEYTEATEGSYVFRVGILTWISFTMYTAKQNPDQSCGNVGKFAQLTIYGLHQKALIQEYQHHILGVLEKKINGMVELYTNNGVTTVYSMVPQRKPESVFTPELPNIIKAVDDFVASKEYYRSKGLTYKTGILLYGPPGTGKSTIIRAIATHLGWGIDYLSPAKYDISNNRVGCGDPRVIVIEDIDCFHETVSRDGKCDKDVTDFQTLINFLDGALSPTDAIFIATTNCIENIAPAIKRPGRFDHIYEIGPINMDMATKMCEYYEVDPEEVLKDIKQPIIPANVQERILKIVGKSNI